MATPLTRTEWLDGCAKLAKTYEEAMTDEAKALVERVETLPDTHALPSTLALLFDLRDCIETQAREIERLREVLGDLLLYAAPNTLGSLPVFNRARAALAGDSHD